MALHTDPNHGRTPRVARTAFKRVLSRGGRVLLALGVLTVLEYLVAVNLGRSALPLLAVMALGKAALIVHYFMHVSQLWNQEE